LIRVLDIPYTDLIQRYKGKGTNNYQKDFGTGTSILYLLFNK